MKKATIFILTALILTTFLFISCQKAKEGERKKEVQMPQVETKPQPLESNTGGQSTKQKEKDIGRYIEETIKNGETIPPSVIEEINKKAMEDIKKIKEDHEKQIALEREKREIEIEKVEPAEVKEGPLTEEEQRFVEEIGEGPLITPNAFNSEAEAIKYLKILLKGDHRTIRFFYGYKERSQSEYAIAINSALYVINTKTNKKGYNLAVEVLKTKWEYPEAMEAAAIHVRFIQDPKIIPLLRPLLKHPDLRVRREAAASLYDLNDANTALPVLEELIEKHGDRGAMVHLFDWKKGEIVKLKDEHGYNILLKAMNHNSVYVRVEATFLLYDAKRISKEDAEKVAINALLNYKPMREYGLSYDSRGELIPIKRIDDTELEKAKKQWGSDNRAYYTAIALLGKLKNTKAIPVLEKFANQVEDSYIKRSAKEEIEFLKSK
ncbi:MAG: HEAT repeat domain-containing protein [Nitrospirota bacterium]